MTAVDEDKVTEFLLRVATDAGAAICGLSVSLGDRLGIYQAMADAGPLTSEELASRTGLVERYVREWLATQVALHYIDYDVEASTYTLPPERAAVLADPLAPTYLAGAFTMFQAAYGTEDHLAQVFRDGGGVGWDEHPEALFTGVAKFFRPGYEASIIGAWLPALDGVVEKLEAGAEVADVGCGFGHSTIIMAKAYPNSRFTGFDYHEPSIVAARKLAAEAGVTDRVRFEVSTATSFAGVDGGYDLVTGYDCLHDMGDPAGAAARVLSTLAPDGTWMLVEPNATERIEESLDNPFARMFYGASVAFCLPSAMAQDGPHKLGNHAGEPVVRDIVTGVGFTRWRRALETPVNRVYEARP